MKQLKKRLLAALTAVVMLASVTAAIAPVKAVESADALSKYVDLEGEWHFKLYRTYEKMYQYFAYSPALSLGKWTDAEAAVYPEDGAWNSWETFDFPADNPETGGLLTNDIFPTWSEAWAVREFEVPADFTDDETVTLLMGKGAVRIFLNVLINQVNNKFGLSAIGMRFSVKNAVHMVIVYTNTGGIRLGRRECNKVIVIKIFIGESN